MANPKPSYLGAFLQHPYNQTAMLAGGVAAIFASMPWGWSGVALVGVLALGMEILAALAVPELPPFRAWVDRDLRHRARVQRQRQLVAELTAHGDSRSLETYQQMWSRVQALYQTAQDCRTTLTREDVEKLEDLTVDYLGLCAVNLSLRQRKDTSNEDIAVKRIASLTSLLDNKNLPEDEARPLRAALAQYNEVLQRSRRMAVRRSTLEATLVSMPDNMEEIYQLVITSPYSTEMGSMLEESLSRLRIAEEVAAEFDGVDNLPVNITMPPAMNRQAQPHTINN